jgi:hypothetical protein
MPDETPNRRTRGVVALFVPEPSAVPEKSRTLIKMAPCSLVMRPGLSSRRFPWICRGHGASGCMTVAPDAFAKSAWRFEIPASPA